MGGKVSLGGGVYGGRVYERSRALASKNRRNALQELESWGREKTIVSYPFLLFIKTNHRQPPITYSSIRR